MTKVLDTVPGLPKDRMGRMICTWLSDVDYAHTGKVFIRTWGYGRYSFHMETGKLERLVMEDGKEYGDPMYAYTLAWPPEFLAPQDKLLGDLHSHPLSLCHFCSCNSFFSYDYLNGLMHAHL